MLYMLQLQYDPQQSQAALSYFWQHGTTLYDSHVTVKEVWVATEHRIAYALVDAADAETMATASQPLRKFGDVHYRHVTSVHEL